MTKELLAVILSSSIMSSALTLVFNYLQKKYEGKNTLKRISRIFLYDITRAKSHSKLVIDANRPIFSDVSIIENWRNDIHELLAYLNKQEAENILSFYSKLDDIKKRQEDYIYTNDEIIRDKTDSKVLYAKNDGVVYHYKLLEEINVTELITKLKKMS